MSLLSEFVATLLPPERALLSKLPLRGKQYEILQAVIRDPNNEQGLERRALELGMTTNHLHSTLSMLLQRAYLAFVPEGGIPLLLYLQAHGLAVHFKKELRSQEHELKEQKASVMQLHEFYLRVLHLLISTTVMRFDEQLFRGILLLCAQNNPEPHPSDPIHFEVCQTLGELLMAIVNPTRNDPTTSKATILEKLLDQKKRLKPYHDPLAHYHLAYAFFIYYSAFVPDASKLEEYITSLSHEIEQLPEAIKADEVPKLALRLASFDFSKGLYKEAYKQYYEQYKVYGIEFYRPYAFHLDRFVRTALVQKQYKMLEELFAVGYIPYLQLGNNPISTSLAIYKCEAAILQNDLKSARAELFSGFSRNKASQFVLAFDIQLRFLEIIIEMLSDTEDSYVLLLITRAIKHLHRKGMTVSSGGDVYLFYILRDILEGNTKSEIIVSFLNEIHVHPALQLIVKNLIKEKARLK